MGFLSKIYERRGAAKLRQARVEQFARPKPPTTSPAGTTPAQKAPGRRIGRPKIIHRRVQLRGKTLGDRATAPSPVWIRTNSTSKTSR